MIKFDAVLLEAAKALKVSSGDNSALIDSQADPQVQRALRELIEALAQKPQPELQALGQDPAARQAIVSGIAQQDGLSVAQTDQLQALVELAAGKAADSVTAGKAGVRESENVGELSGPQGGSPEPKLNLQASLTRMNPPKPDDRALESAQSSALAGEVVRLAGIFTQPILISTRTGGVSSAENGLSPALNQTQAPTENARALQVVVGTEPSKAPVQGMAPKAPGSQIAPEAATLAQSQKAAQPGATAVLTAAQKAPRNTAAPIEPQVIDNAPLPDEGAQAETRSWTTRAPGEGLTQATDQPRATVTTTAAEGRVTVTKVGLNTQELLGPLPQADPDSIVTVRSTEPQSLPARAIRAEAQPTSIPVPAEKQLQPTVTQVLVSQAPQAPKPTGEGDAAPQQPLRELPATQAAAVRPSASMPIQAGVTEKEHLQPATASNEPSHDEDFAAVLGATRKQTPVTAWSKAGTEGDATGARTLSQPERQAVLSHVLDTVSEAAQQNSRIRITLSPDWLGEVDVELSMEGARLTAKLVASKPETHEILVSNLQHFKQDLEKQGLIVQELSVGVRAQTQQQGQTRDQSWAWQQRQDERHSDRPAMGTALWGAFSGGSESQNQRFSALA